MNKKKIILLVLAVLAVLLMAGGILGIRAVQDTQYRNAHIFVEDTAYPKDAAFLDLRGTGISPDHYNALQAQLPDCEILWDVPFQNTFIASDTAALTLTSLSEEDLAVLDYFPELTAVDASGCTDYEQLMAFRQKYPGCALTYQVLLGDTSYDPHTKELTCTQAEQEELMEKLAFLPELETLHIVQPTLDSGTLLQLREVYPEVAITWELDVFGKTYADNVTELDFSGIPMEGPEYVEKMVRYFPDLQTLLLCDCGMDNETMAALRDRLRDHCKVVWSVEIAGVDFRTDITTFMPAKHKIKVNDEKLKVLYYCEDLVVVDLGHNMLITDLNWIYGTPHLQYLILVECGFTDITPIGTLKELVYLELFLNPQLTDYSPLVECTALEDLNVAISSGDTSVFARMPWLNNLWVNRCNVSPETRELLIRSLPDTHIEFDVGWHMGNNWRALLNYFKQRDLLEMPYYDWGNTLGRPGEPGYPFDDIPD